MLAEKNPPIRKDYLFLIKISHQKRHLSIDYTIDSSLTFRLSIDRSRSRSYIVLSTY